MRFQTIRRVTLATAVATTAMLVAPAAGLAQGTTTTGATGTANAGTMGADTTRMTTMPVREEEHHDYGWVGLLGLAGLAGLRRREPHVVHRDPVSTGTGREGTARDTMR
jgi:MYXO-CTERM domain-containing protein